MDAMTLNISPKGNVQLTRPMGGTELMVSGLERHLGEYLSDVAIGVNCRPADTTLPAICWFHHDYDQPSVQWLRNGTDGIAAFVFVSHWQRERYQMLFNLPPERCHVLRNAIDWRDDVKSRTGRRYAYTSTPFRGLDVLLDAWEQAEMPEDAELHLYTSMAIYGQPEGPYEQLYKRAQSMPGVFYRGYKPNHEVRAALADTDFLVYPATWEETSCLSVIEAMAAGCQVICPAYGALPETTAGFANMYPWIDDREQHAARFADILRSSHPGASPLQTAYARLMYGWDVRTIEWRRLIEAVT